MVTLNSPTILKLRIFDIIKLYNLLKNLYFYIACAQKIKLAYKTYNNSIKVINYKKIFCQF